MYLITIAANENGNNQRTTSQTELYGNGHARDGQGERTEDKTNHDAYEDGGNIGCVQTTDRVTHLVGYAVDGILRTNNHDAVTYLQGQAGRGKDIHAVTGDTGHVDTVNTGEMKRSQRFAVELRIGNHNAL